MNRPIQRPYMQVDVFTATAFQGNPLAVVLSGEGLSDSQMQAFAAWTQLSETTFVFPPSPEGRAAGADYRVRIFTPGTELPFAGHPTLGTAAAWLAHGGRPQHPQQIVQECGVGLVTLQPHNGLWAFAAPPLRRSDPAPERLTAVRNALGLRADEVLAAQELDNGPLWMGLWLRDASTVLAIEPDHAALKHWGIKVGVAARRDAGSTLIRRSNREARAFVGSEPDTTDIEVRAFAAAVGVPEDPVTGSLNASLAQWLMAEGLMPSQYRACQGTAVGRRGEVHLSQDGQRQIWVGGEVVLCIRGEVEL